MEDQFTVVSGCRSCGSESLRLVLDYGLMPLAGGFVKEDDPRIDLAFPLRLMHCDDCTLMQVAETVDPTVIFSEYSYASSVNRTLARHFEKASESIASLCNDGDYVAEFGCNDGVLLNPLAERGVKVVGIDPSDVAQRASDAAGWPLYRSYFSSEAAESVLAEHGPAKVIAANNVCAHVEDPNVLIAGVEILLAPDGRFIFEVHYQGDLIELNQFDTVYHEHTCYYSLRSLEVLLARHGLMVVDAERITTHCGSIRVTAARIDRNIEASPVVAEILAAEANWDIDNFAKRVDARRRVLRRFAEDLAASGRSLVAYGASGRATVLLNFCGLGPDLVSHVSDLSPLRHGRHVPGVKVPVLPRSEFQNNPSDYALLTAWNYEEEILKDEADFREQGGIFIVPLPEVRLV